jgi:farnesyl diphosphate synthase
MQQLLQALQTDTKTYVIDTFYQYLSLSQLPESRLRDAMQYALLNGGKRMRPLLVNLVGGMLGAEQQDINATSLALECIHAYSLIHDDLPAMDDDALRRGKPTCHIQFGESTAILAGDALQTMAFDAISSLSMSAFANTQRLQLIHELAKASGASGMCLGQSLDLIATNEQIEVEALMHLHSLKTGALLIASVRMGAIICEQAKETDLSILSTFAQHIGLAFQIQDDILDVTADTETLGKQQGSDVTNNKTTFVTQLGLDGARTALSSHHEQALTALEALPYNTKTLEMFTDYMMTRTF